MGATQTRCAQTSVTLFPFPTAHHRPGSHADLSNCSLRIALDERNCFAVFSNQFNDSPKLVMPPCCASSAMRSEQFCLFRLCIAGDVLLRSEKEGRLSERSELCVPPDCSDTAPGTPKGRCIAVAFFCLLFLGETRKVSGCRAAPGNAPPVRRNQNISNNDRQETAAPDPAYNKAPNSTCIFSIAGKQRPTISSSCMRAACTLIFMAATTSPRKLRIGTAMVRKPNSSS